MEGRNHLKGIKKLRRMIIYDNNFDNKARQPGLLCCQLFTDLSTKKKKSVVNCQPEKKSQLTGLVDA